MSCPTCMLSLLFIFSCWSSDLTVMNNSLHVKIVPVTNVGKFKASPTLASHWSTAAFTFILWTRVLNSHLHVFFRHVGIYTCVLSHMYWTHYLKIHKMADKQRRCARSISCSWDVDTYWYVCVCVCVCSIQVQLLKFKKQLAVRYDGPPYLCTKISIPRHSQWTWHITNACLYFS